MRRFFSLLLMLMLPLQFSIALAGTYCVGEEPDGIAHFGHHAHADEHKAAPDNASGQEQTECEACHLVCAKLQTVTRVPAVVPNQLPLEVAPPFSSPQHSPEPPDRPPIVLAA